MLLDLGAEEGARELEVTLDGSLGHAGHCRNLRDRETGQVPDRFGSARLRLPVVVGRVAPPSCAGAFLSDDEGGLNRASTGCADVSVQREPDTRSRQATASSADSSTSSNDTSSPPQPVPVVVVRVGLRWPFSLLKTSWAVRGATRSRARRRRLATIPRTRATGMPGATRTQISRVLRLTVYEAPRHGSPPRRRAATVRTAGASRSS